MWDACRWSVYCGVSTDVRCVCRLKESRLSGFFSSIKQRASGKATPTSPTPSTTVTVTTAKSDAPPPEQAVTSSDPTPALTPEPVAAPVATEVKGHAQEGAKRGGPLTGHHMGVKMLGNDMLAEIRAKQEKRKKVSLDVVLTV